MPSAPQVAAVWPSWLIVMDRSQPSWACSMVQAGLGIASVVLQWTWRAVPHGQRLFRRAASDADQRGILGSGGRETEGRGRTDQDSTLGVRVLYRWLCGRVRLEGFHRPQCGTYRLGVR